MLRLRTLGGLSLEGSDDGGSSLGKRPLTLLALLAITGARGIRREKVIALLWPESDEERGRNSLSQALTALRRLLGSEGIDTGAQELRIQANVLASDVHDLDQAVAAGDLERAVSIYAGPFLDGVHIKGAAGFEEWASAQRLRLHRCAGTSRTSGSST